MPVSNPPSSTSKKNRSSSIIGGIAPFVPRPPFAPTLPPGRHGPRPDRCAPRPGSPSAIFTPWSSTTTWLEMSMTTPMSCSISTTVVPNWSFTSRTKRAMSSFSSRFMPAIGSSRSSTLGSIASARASSTRFCSPYGSFPTGVRRIAWISRKSMMRSTNSRCRISSCCAGPRYRASVRKLYFILRSRPVMMLSRVLIPRNSAMFWNVRAKPSRATSNVFRCVRSWPSNRMRPLVGR